MFVPNELSFSSTEIRRRIRDLRHIHGYSKEYMSHALGIALDDYIDYETGDRELNYAFLYTCSQLFNVDISELIEGDAPTLSSYSITRNGEGQQIDEANGMVVRNLASRFRNRIFDPLIVNARFDPDAELRPIPCSAHHGHECDIVIKGRLRVQVGEHTEELGPGDSIFYASSMPHGMIAIGGEDCEFIAVMASPEDINFDLPDDKPEANVPVLTATRETGASRIWERYIDVSESGTGILQDIHFKNIDNFNFAFDVVDVLGSLYPDKTALVHLDKDKVERTFTFKDISKKSGRAANYFESLGIKKGDRVLLVMRRTWQFWPILIALEKIGAVSIPVTDQLLAQDFYYRFQTAGISAVICTADGPAAAAIDPACDKYGRINAKIIVNGPRDGWNDFDSEYDKLSARYLRSRDSIGGDDLMMMIFQSGSNGLPRPVCHNCKYPLASFVTGYYWNCDDPDKLNMTVSDTAWAKAIWGKVFGPWLCESGVFAYDFESFSPDDMLGILEKYDISSFCAPPSMFRFLANAELSKYDLSSLKHVCAVGEAMSPDIFTLFRDASGLSIMNGYGLTETALLIGNFVGMVPKAGSMGRSNPMYDIRLLGSDGREVETGEPGEVCISVKDGLPIGLFTGYFSNGTETPADLHDGYYHTGDLAWKDEDDYYWYMGRIDDVIKCSGYRIGPFEVESVIMELPYVLECGVSAVNDDIRGQVVKASVVLEPGKEPDEDLKTEIQNYVKTHTAPYKYPRVIEFRSELPKTSDGKIIRSKL